MASELIFSLSSNVLTLLEELHIPAVLPLVLIEWKGRWGGTSTITDAGKREVLH